DLLPPHLAERVIGAGIVIKRRRAAIRGPLIGPKPVLADNDGVGRDRAHLLDEPAEMERDLRIGRAIVGTRGRDDLRLAEIIDLHHPRHHGPAHRLPDKGGGEASRQDQRAEGHAAPVLRLNTGRADTLVPCLRGLLIGRLGFRRFAVVGRWPFEDAHERSLSERLTEEPEPWLSPERTAWAAMVVPWLRACERCIRCAHAGGLPAGPDAAATGSALAPPTVPALEEPPVTPKAARAPPEKLDLTDSVACETARFKGETAADPAARATPPRPDATPAAPDWPSAPTL